MSDSSGNGIQQDAEKNIKRGQLVQAFIVSLLLTLFMLTILSSVGVL